MLQPFFEWMQGLSFSNWILTATWASPILQCIHLLALVVFSGAVLIVDIRLLGRGLIKTPLAQLARAAQPWLFWSFVVLVLTGLPQMASTALKQYYSPHFWWKMQTMGVALIFTFTIRRKVSLMADERLGKFLPKIIALISIGLWTSIAIWARLIGLLS